MAPLDFESELDAARLKVANAGEWITDVATDLAPVAGRLPVDTKLALAQAHLAMATYAVIDALAVALRGQMLWTPERLREFAQHAVDEQDAKSALAAYSVPLPTEPPSDVEVEVDPMDRGLDVTVLLSTTELIAVCKNDTDTYPDAGKVEVPAAWADLKRRASIDAPIDFQARRFVAQTQGQQ